MGRLVNYHNKEYDSDEIAAELFKRWEVEVPSSVEGLNDRASFTSTNGGGVVNLRVPGRPRSDSFVISMSYIETAEVEISKEIKPQVSSNVLVENGQSGLAELEHEANVVFVPKIWKQGQYRPFQGNVSTTYVNSTEGTPENES